MTSLKASGQLRHSRGRTRAREHTHTHNTGLGLKMETRQHQRDKAEVFTCPSSGWEMRVGGAGQQQPYYHCHLVMLPSQLPQKDGKCCITSTFIEPCRLGHIRWFLSANFLIRYDPIYAGGMVRPKTPLTTRTDKTQHTLTGVNTTPTWEIQH